MQNNCVQESSQENTSNEDQRLHELRKKLQSKNTLIFRGSECWVFDAKIVKNFHKIEDNSYQQQQQSCAIHQTTKCVTGEPQVVSCNAMGEIVLWQPTTCAEYQPRSAKEVILGASDEYKCYRLQYDDLQRTLYCSTNKGIVLRIASDRSVRHLKIHNDTINGLAINKNAPNILYTSSLDETAVVYDIEKQTIKSSIWAGFKIGQVVHSTEMNLLAVSGLSRYINLYDERTRRLVRQLDSTTNQTFVKLLFLQTPQYGHVLASGDHSNRLLLWDLVRGDCVLVDQHAQKSVFGIAYSPRLDVLFSSSWDSEVRALDLTSRQVVQKYSEHDYKAIACEFDEESGWLVSTGRDSRVVARKLRL